jgi:phage terminase small subunit
MATKKKQTKAPVKKKSREVRKQATYAITDKHKLFAMHYALTGNAEDSAMKAGFTKATARKISYKWIGQTRAESFYPDLFDIAEDVRDKQIKPKLEKQFNITADRVLQELARLGFSDVRRLFDDTGVMKAIHELDDDTAACISSIEIEALYEGSGKDKFEVGQTKKVKFWDKKGPLEMLANHLGIIKNKMELTGKDGKPIDLATKIIHEVNFKKSGADLKRN